MSDLLRIFVGSDERAEKAEKALEHSIAKHTPGDFQIHWMRAGDPGFTIGDGAEWNIGRQPGRPYSGRGWATEFTCFRFAVPELAGFQGRAIYLDSDMLVLGDLQELLDLPQDKPWLCVSQYRTDVSVIDCEAFRSHPGWPSLSHMKQCGQDLKYYWDILTRHGLVAPTVPAEWDCLDRYHDGAKLLHFTYLITQPWRPWPDALQHEEHPDPRARDLFWKYYDEATGGVQEVR